MQSWREANPGWGYELWDDARCAAFGLRNAVAFAAMREWCGKADILRYEILERHGGVFIDADSMALRPLDDALLDHDCWACFESERARPGLVANGYLGAVPGCPLMRLLMHAIAGIGPGVAAARAWRTTGPALLTRIARSYPELHVYPSHLFIPRHYSGLVQRGPEPPYAEQLWGSTRGLYPPARPA